MKIRQYPLEVWFPKDLYDIYCASKNLSRYEKAYGIVYNCVEHDDWIICKAIDQESQEFEQQEEKQEKKEVKDLKSLLDSI